ncbi:hypothetical protein ABT282_15860 [Streptomyces sp. NPDC000927]|uniref:WDGH domain-containing protein n=1 Tax=Streptomyces sp. NPDC000927 TaxID=3154371 RepID=UPI003329BB13
MNDRIRLSDLTDDQLDALYDRVAELETETAKLAEQLADASGDLAEARDHNDATCEAVAARDQAQTALDATYRERAHLVAHLAALHPSHIGHTDPNLPDWAVVTIETPAGQMTWHIAERDMDLFTRVQPTNRICRGWDGHTTDEKYQRMRDLTKAAPSLLSLEVVADQQAEHIKQLTAQLTKSEQGRRNLRGLLEHHRDQGSLGILRTTRTRLARALKACARYRAEITEQAARALVQAHRREIDALTAQAQQAEATITRLRRSRRTWADHARRLCDRALTAEAANARVRAELNALDAETHRLNPVALAGRRDAVARIRAALDQPTTTPEPQP